MSKHLRNTKRAAVAVFSVMTLLVAMAGFAEENANVKRCKDQGGVWIVEWEKGKAVGVCYGGKGEGKIFECKSLLECRDVKKPRESS